MGITVSEGEARTIEAPRLGFAGSTTTSVAYVNLSTWARSYVTITAETEACYISFGSATGFSMSTSTASLGTSGVAYPLLVGEKIYVVVHPDYPWLGYRSTTGNGVIRVHKS